ncbi:hypothetical protein [Gaetbulibacter sp. PBL-D1]|uniref:hypothetical protein n=1 Tax=Gaetbulibacter sp. PBL-D1 TaxID=3422594 RepID=UPI003D2F106D
MIFQSCLNFGEEIDYPINSNEAKNDVESLLQINFYNKISNLHYYKNNTGIDPYACIKFETSPKLIDSIISLKNFELDNSKYERNYTLPKWFNPESIKNPKHYSNTNVDYKTEHLIIDKSKNMVYYFYSTR